MITLLRIVLRKSNQYPIPNIDSHKSKLANECCFLKIDVTSANSVDVSKTVLTALSDCLNTIM